MFKKVVITTTLAGTLLLAPNVSEAALGDRYSLQWHEQF